MYSRRGIKRDSRSIMSPSWVDKVAEAALSVHASPSITTPSNSVSIEAPLVSLESMSLKKLSVLIALFNSNIPLALSSEQSSLNRHPLNRHPLNHPLNHPLLNSVYRDADERERLFRDWRALYFRMDSVLRFEMSHSLEDSIIDLYIIGVNKCWRCFDTCERLIRSRFFGFIPFD